MSNIRKLTCICPKCEKTHKLKIRWIGLGTPRMYCSSCKSKISRTHDPLYGNGSKSISHKNHSE